MKKAGVALVALVFAISIGGCTATEQFTQRIIVAEKVFDQVAGAEVTAMAAAGSNSNSNSNCSLKYTYTNLVNDGQAWMAVDRAEDQNTTQSPITIAFSSSSAVTVSTSFSIGLSVNASGALGAVFVSVQGQINSSVTKTVSTVVGNQATVTVPAGGVANGIYGVKVQVTTGHLNQSDTCGSAKNYGNVQTYVPIASGWCVWPSGHTPCRLVQGN